MAITKDATYFLYRVILINIIEITINCELKFLVLPFISDNLFIFSKTEKFKNLKK